MKKKGFTLIELLAVIVILAIIALIATPIVMNVIENSKKGAAERSAENYLRAVETAIAAERLDGPVEDGKYKVNKDGDLVQEKNGTTIIIEIDVNGTLPEENSVIVIVNGLVDKTEVKIIIGNYTVTPDEEGNLKAEETENKGEIEEPTEEVALTVYRWSTETISLNQEIDPTDTTKFTPDPTTLGKNYYLKHIVENNIVKESYVCAIINSEIGEKCVRGGKDENGNAYFAANKLILEGLQDKADSCNFRDTTARCYYGSISLDARSGGLVKSYEGSDYCIIDGSGASHC